MTEGEQDLALDATLPGPARAAEPPVAHDVTLGVGSAPPAPASGLDATLGTAHARAAPSPSQAPGRIPARVANLGFAAGVTLAAANLAYYVIRFLVAADPPVLTSIFRGSPAGATPFASASAFDGPLLTHSRDVLVATVFFAMAMWLSRRNRDPFARMLGGAGALAGQYSIAVTVLTSTETLHPWRELAAVIYVALPVIGLLTLSLYPNRQPVPRWSVRLVPLAIAPFVLQAATMYRTRGYSVPLAGAGLLVFGTYLGFQAYRFRRRATLREQHRIKWLTYALGVFLAIQSIAVVGILPQLADPTRAAFPVLKILYEVLLASAYLIALVVMLFSSARYRVWDIDRVINRTVVYALLALIVAGATGVAFFALDGLLRRALATSAPIAAAVAIVLAAAAFAPMRKRIARWIDRRFYGIGVDYEALAAKAVRAASLALPTSGTSIGAYDELVLLGRGGMGAVYRAHHADFAVPVALKVMSPALASDDDARARFVREAELLEQLRHTNVIPFLASGHDHGLSFIAMQYIEGEDLAAVVRARGALALAEIVPVVEGIAAALDLAHRRGVVHRDVKPANVLVEGHARDPLATRRPLLVDFGVAQLPEDATQELEVDAIVGSLPYIAPEQIKHPNRVDGRADVYSLGATVYELVTGRPPFRETSALGMVMAHLRQPVDDPREHVPSLPAPAAAALVRALAKDPEARFATAGELAETLRAALAA